MSSDWQTNVPLASYTTLRLGGSAQRLMRVHTQSQLIDALREVANEKFFVLGGGSNLVVSDDGYAGAVLAMQSRGIETFHETDRVRVVAQAGEPWDEFVAQMVELGAAGIECLSGIPGLVGATPIQNVGAYGQEVADTITRVHVIDTRTFESKWIEAAQCAFAYRDSMFKRDPGRFIVVEVEFSFRKDAPVVPAYAELTRALASRAAPTLRDVRETIIALRRAKGMVLDANDPDSCSAGSFFLNAIVPAVRADEIEQRARDLGVLGAEEKMPRFPAQSGFSKVPAAWLIERAGIKKGLRRRNVGVSSKHTLALVHHGGGTTRELLALADEIRATVHEKFGVTLEREPILIA